MDEIRKIAIVGSRETFWKKDQIPIIKNTILELISYFPKNSVIISGECPYGGVDMWAKETSQSLGYAFIGYAPDKSLPFTQACHIRNQQIVDNCTELIAIPAEGARGTLDTIRRAKLVKKIVTEITYENGKCKIIFSL